MKGVDILLREIGGKCIPGTGHILRRKIDDFLCKPGITVKSGQELRVPGEIRSDKGMLYLTVTPEDATEASAAVEAYAKANGYDRMVGSSVALCVEEMAAYAKASRNSGKVNIEIVIHFTPQGATFLMFDDGEYLALDKYNELEKLVTDNYGLLLKVARTADYQYVTSMNHTVFYFENKEAGL